MTTIQQNWINFKTRFRTAHRKLEEIGELKMEDTGYHQSNPFNDVVSPMSGLPCPYPPQETAYNLVPNSAPTIVSTYPISQCRHIYCFQYHILATDQHATYAATADTDTYKQNRREETNHKPKHPLSSHSTGIN